MVKERKENVWQKIRRLYTNAGFKATTQNLTALYMKLIIPSITIEVKGIKEMNLVEFNPLEKSIIRDSKLRIPNFNIRETSKVIENFLRVKIYLLKVKPKIEFESIIGGIVVKSIKDFKTFGEIESTLFILLEENKSKHFTFCKERLDRMERDYNNSKEIYEQYLFECNNLKQYINDYLSSTPELEQFKEIKFRNIQLPESQGYSFKDYKPTFDPIKKEITMYSYHEEGELHINTEFKIQETGIIIFGITKTERTYGKHFGTNIQNYYFVVKENRYYRKNANIIKIIGDIDKWELCYFNKVQYQEKGIFSKCFICEQKLHFPSMPVKIDENWVFILKPCCSCFKKSELNPLIIEEAIDKLIFSGILKESSYFNFN